MIVYKDLIVQGILNAGKDLRLSSIFVDVGNSSYTAGGYIFYFVKSCSVFYLGNAGDNTIVVVKNLKVNDLTIDAGVNNIDVSGQTTMVLGSYDAVSLVFKGGFWYIF